uniref:Large ribosomal subunit protein bL33c n=1 Tax=Hypertelis spergulacea TaxID=764270 RepID=A0A411L8W0_9CARY|nr:ribosomal protein L33 [Hypertelis spergulacea]
MAKGKEARVRVILECTGCVRRKSLNNESRGIYRYITQKNRHNTPSQLEFRKFCPYCSKPSKFEEIKK